MQNNEEFQKEYKRILEISKKNPISKESAINFFKEMSKDIEESIKYTESEIDFECACMDGDYNKVEHMLNNVPYLTKRPEYIKDQIEYVEEEIENNGITEGLSKVLEILKTRPDCWK